MNYKILVVDDDKDTLILANQRLKLLGYEGVLTARSGEDALVLINENDIDLLITDAIMPNGMTGWELAEKAENVKLIITSGYSRGALLNAGQSKFQLNMLQKPYTIDDLQRKINEVMIF